MIIFIQRETYFGITFCLLISRINSHMILNTNFRIRNFQNERLLFGASFMQFSIYADIPCDELKPFQGQQLAFDEKSLG